MHLLRFETLDGIVYLPADRFVSLAASEVSDEQPRSILTMLASDDKLFSIPLAGEVDEIAAMIESSYRACELFRIK